MRTDLHRPGAIVPAAYSYEESYFLPGIDDPGFNVSYVGDLCEAHIKAGGKVFGGLGNCGICGAGYRYGDLWKHENGDLLHVGHDCANKYQMLANRSDFDAAKSAMERNHKARLQAEANKVANAKFLSLHPGLETALQEEHRILADLRSKLWRYQTLSDKQVALAMKIAGEVQAKKNAPPAPEEKHVPAPIVDKRQTVEGVVVGKKFQEGPYGDTLRITVKVETPEGTWLTWGTCPSSLKCERGDRIRFDARLTAGREAHFCFFKRPTNAEVVGGLTSAQDPATVVSASSN